LFANSFFVKADAYYHSGFYPTIYDNNEAFKTPHMAADTGTVAENNHGDETGFMGKPRDFIESFSRNFIPDHHTHLDEGGPTGDLSNSSEVREILPWLRLSAELNPNDIRTYTVTAYWLRERMNKADVAEEFLREGLRANPDSYEILYELGRVYAENKNDPERARNLWLAALRHWQKQEPAKKEPNDFLFVEITGHLALLEEKQGNYQQALGYWEMCKEHSPAPQQIQKRIDEMKQRSADKSKTVQ